MTLIKTPSIKGFSTCSEIIAVIGTPVALLMISGLEAMEQIVKGAGIEKSGPADLEHLLGKVAEKTVPRRRPMKCGWHPQLANYTTPIDHGKFTRISIPLGMRVLSFYSSSFGNSLGATMVPSSLITDLAKAIYALLTRFSGCFRMMGKPSSPDSATLGSIGISPRKGTLYS